MTAKRRRKTASENIYEKLILRFIENNIFQCTGNCRDEDESVEQKKEMI